MQGHSRVRELRRARIERGAGDVPEEPGDKYDEQVAVRHADASGGDIKEKQHEEKRKRDIQVNERGSEATNEEQADEGRKMVRFEQEAPNTSASSDPFQKPDQFPRFEVGYRQACCAVELISIHQPRSMTFPTRCCVWEK